MTVEELKTEASKLSPPDRFALAEWIENNDDIRELRRTVLTRDIKVGLDELDAGDYVDCKDESELRSLFDEIKSRGRQSIGTQKESAA